ncbi:hypothetical protein SAMN02745245_00504 [Anaerosphaera aminiphila DSM 21120]|uniref:DinB superfamily protein n=1 Tax=Anaerosphaera aminiphila DSM 21120 TaxID=1120995 RepID=A0A1M5Q5M0_9FIRM|nr:ClbS/DfsB family four-helix bundle protein [Anaerosphaera aminiphila]SHH09111.1 hypothetical protein SAMN02745245_00504 [Anaerosphaera aminiphila DSM 21120]
MARPTTKADLLIAADSQYKKLMELIQSMSEEEISTPFNFEADLKKKEAHWNRDKNIRDVLIHLYEWHNLLINWVSANRVGDDKPFLPEPYNWKTYGKMNVEFWEKHQSASQIKAEKMLEKSHVEVIKIIDSFTDEELFTKKYFPWTGTSSLGSYCISATSSHYDWAIKKLKAHIKNVKALNS